MKILVTDDNIDLADGLGFVMVTTLGGTIYPVIPVLYGLASLVSIAVLNARWKGR